MGEDEKYLLLKSYRGHTEGIKSSGNYKLRDGNS